MSSFIMHIAITKKIQQKLGFGTEFLLGSILPDLYKIILKDRSITHFQIEDGNEELPNIKKFCEEYKEKRSELVYGYLAHLAEDKLWFHEYIYEKYVRRDGEEQYLYLKDYSKHSSEEFANDIYTDYDIIDEYIINKEKLNIEKISEELKNCVEKIKIPYPEKVKELIEEKIVLNKNVNVSNKKITFFEKKDADEYFECAVKNVEETINLLM